MNQNSRRGFLKKSLLAGAAISFSARSWADVAGANSDIRMATIGFNGQGMSHIEGFGKVPGVRYVALCDVDSMVLERGVKKLGDGGAKVQGFQDIRRMLELKEIDAVSIATPNHWHALAAIWSIQAGKDVYVEKPVSHNVWEGRKIVEAARKHKKIVQTGTQSRSNPGLREAVAYVQAGNLGKVKLVRGLCYKRRASIGKANGPQKPPATVDYDLWCGPAPKDPLMRTKLHYDWHWVWPTGNGDLGNQGIHQMDIGRWVLGEKELSPKVMSIGGRLGYEDDGTTPNTQIVFHDYKKAPLIFEVRGLPSGTGKDKMDDLMGSSIGVIVYCEHGNVVITTYSNATAFDLQGNVLKKFEGSASHHANFIGAVRSRKITDLNADILEGHISSGLCHTGNISYRLGATASTDQIKDAIKNSKGAGESLDRMLGHLRANGVDVAATPLKLGPLLTMNPKRETFGDKAADALLRREYRAPFEVPGKV